MTIDRKKLNKAREWAGKIGEREIPGHLGDLAEVIQSLPDVIVDGDKLREISSALLTEAVEVERTDPARASTLTYAANSIDTLLPSPEPQVEIALGAWAMHPEYGKVLIAAARPDSEGDVRVVCEVSDRHDGSDWAWAAATDLSPLPDTHDDSEEQSEYAPGGVLPERSSAEKEQMHHTLDKLTQPDTEPQNGEVWEVAVDDEKFNAIVSGAGYLYVDTVRTWSPARFVAPLRRLVPAQEPRVLTSFPEYKSAGVGTVVRDGSKTTTKEDYSYWRDTDGIDYTDSEMAYTSRTVLWEPEV